MSDTLKSPLESPRRCHLRDVLVNPDALHEDERNSKLDEKWREKAEHELGETKEIAFTKLRKLRHMVKKVDATIHGRLDDAFLLRFLRAKKFDEDKAFKMIQKYATMKEQSPELFKVSPPSQLRDLLEMQIQLMLPLRDANGRQIYVFRVEKCDPYKCPVESVFRSNVLALEQAAREPETQIAGISVLLNMAGLSIGHARFLSPHLAKRTVEVIQESFPLRFKAFHILHEPFYFDAILAVLKPFLKEKIRRRIHLHGSDLASLHRHIPKEILPVEYGGTQPPFDNTIWRQNILDNHDYFVRLENYNATNGGASDNELSAAMTGMALNGRAAVTDDWDSPVHSVRSGTDGQNGVRYIDTETDDSEYEDSREDGSMDNFNDLTPTADDLMMKHEIEKIGGLEMEIANIKSM